MSALNEIAKIKKHKLKSFQKEINAIRSGFLSDKIIQEWKELPDSERKLKITVFLCMAMVSEKDLEHIAKIINPWWEPYQIVAKVLAALLVLFFSFQLATYFLAERVYPKNELFEAHPMIYKNTDSGAILLDGGIIDWLIMDSKTSRFDSTKWTKDKELNQDLEFFYGEFQGNTLISEELKKAPLSIEDIYKASVKVTGMKKIKMDLYVPARFSNDHSPFLQFTYLNNISFFLTVKEGSRYWNIKIEFRDGKPIKWGELLFSPTYQRENQQKVIWEKKLYRPAAKKISKGLNDQPSNNYFNLNLDTFDMSDV